MWKEAAVAYLQALYCHLFGVYEENQGKPPSA